MDNPQNTIEKCMIAKIPFIVAISHIGAKNSALEGAGKDYFLVALLKDIMKIKPHYYKLCKNQITAEVTLNENDYEYFKTVSDDFKKVIHAAEGRIYEYKNAESLHTIFRDICKQIEGKKEKAFKKLAKTNCKKKLNKIKK